MCEICCRETTVRRFEGLTICLFCLMFVRNTDVIYNAHVVTLSTEAWDLWDTLAE